MSPFVRNWWRAPSLSVIRIQCAVAWRRSGGDDIQLESVPGRVARLLGGTVGNFGTGGSCAVHPKLCTNVRN